MRRIALSIVLAGATALLSACQPVVAPLPSVQLPGAPSTAGDRPVPPSIDATGSSDVTAKLQRFLRSVEPGETVRFPEGGRYRIDGTVRLIDQHDLAIEGNGAELFAVTSGDRTRSILRIEGGSGFVIRDLVFTGANPAAGTGDAAYRSSREAQHGVEILGANDITLDDIVVTDVYGDFVYIGGRNVRQPDRSWQFSWSEGIVVRESRFVRNGRQGIAITAGSDVLIEDNVIKHTRRATFDIEPSGPRGGARNVRIVGNDVGPGRLNFVTISGRGTQVSGITVAENDLARPFQLVAKSSDRSRRSDLVVRDNRSTQALGSPNAAIELHDFSGAVVEGNTIPLKTGRGMAAVGLTRSCGVVVGDNDFPGESQRIRGPNPPC